MKLNTLSLVLFALLTYFAATLGVEAVVPAPDGGYPNGNTAEGQNALFSLTTGGYNTAVGLFSLRSDATGSFNTAIGAGTLLANTGDSNTAVGVAALLSTTTGPSNTANGAFALFNNTIGASNTAVGIKALFSNTTGSFNTASGINALFSNTLGDDNTATGDGALYSNTQGMYNTAIGHSALLFNTTGSENTAMGDQALMSNSTGFSNTAIGPGALQNSAGNTNTAVGLNAGFNVMKASGVICLANPGADVDNTTWIGNVYGVTTQNGTAAPVVVSAEGQLGTVVSSQRFKTDIASMADASEAILLLRPVTFHYKTDTENTSQFGLIAEEVANVSPALVLPDKEGKPYTVRYDAVNAMLLNEFLKARRQIDSQQKQIDALTAGLQKVSAQLELGKPATQTVLNRQ